MATIGNLNPTLLDISQRAGFDQKIQAVIEIIGQQNEIIQDMTWKEANQGSGEKTSIRTGYPSGTWRKFNYGVLPGKSTTRQVTDTCGMLEAYAEIDKALADLNGNTAEWRLSEDKAFLEGMNQQFCQTLMYGDITLNPERFMGLAPRFGLKSTDTANIGSQIVDAGGTGADNTSIWLVTWDQTVASGIYPQGSMAGFQSRDLGEQTLYDDQTPVAGRYQGYRTHYKWDCGLTIRDWRYIVRIANIDVSDLTNDAASGADLIDLMVIALEKLHTQGYGRPVFYVNRTVRGFLRRQLTNKTNIWLSMDEAAGKKVLSFGGVPVRLVDQILNTEARVV